MFYDIGDVVLVHFPYKDEYGNIHIKVRPAIINEFLGDRERMVIQITSKNRIDKLNGIWVKKNSKRGNEMGILLDSFINLTYTLEVQKEDIIRKIGYCSFMDEIDEMM